MRKGEIILGYDPGVCSGWAFASTTEGLLACGIFESRHFEHVVFDHPTFQPDRLVIEYPQVYTRAEGDPNDLIKLAIQVGKIGYYYASQYQCDVQYVKPADWKGQLPKGVHHQRIWSKANNREQRIISDAGTGLAASKLHNMMDAVGLVQWRIARWKAGSA